MPEPTAPAITTVGEEIGDDVMASVNKRFGFTPAAPAAKPADTPPARNDGETDEDYTARLAEAGFAADGKKIDPNASPADETDEERQARLQKQDGETDEDYTARLAEEGLTPADVPSPTVETDADKALAADLQKLPEAQRKAVKDLLAKHLAAATTPLRDEATAARTEADSLRAQLTETQSAAEGKPRQVIVPQDVHPLLLADSAREIDDYETKLDGFVDWLEDHSDGYEPTESEAAQGYKAASAEDIRKRLKALRRERERILPAARKALADRATHEASARAAMPSVFDAKSPDYQAAQKLLREQPEIKRLPDYHLRLAWMVAGQKALAAEAAAREAAAKGKKDVKPATPPKKAPRVPGGGGPAKGGVNERPTGALSNAPEAVKAFAKAPSRQSLSTAVAAFLT